MSEQTEITRLREQLTLLVAVLDVVSGWADKESRSIEFGDSADKWTHATLRAITAACSEQNPKIRTILVEHRKKAEATT